MNNSSGKIGERYVLQMLLEQGYTFIDANYHSRFGEIDIIVADDKYIVFVEVKTRDEKSISTPLEAVTFSYIGLMHRLEIIQRLLSSHFVRNPNSKALCPSRKLSSS